MANAQRQKETKMDSTYKKKLEAAKKYLGRNWVLSKEYISAPAHRVAHSYFMQKVREEAVARGKLV